MTMNEAVAYIANAAKELGYSYAEFTAAMDDLKEILYSVEETDKETLDEFIKEHL